MHSPFAPIRQRLGNLCEYAEGSVGATLSRNYAARRGDHLFGGAQCRSEALDLAYDPQLVRHDVDAGRSFAHVETLL
jgi:hypothetical protein